MRPFLLGAALSAGTVYPFLAGLNFYTVTMGALLLYFSIPETIKILRESK
jgi:hypothetical protein